MANDKIRVAGIGMGIMGFGDMRAALKVPGVEIAGVCDLYQGHLDRAKELYGKDLFTTRDFREILQRKDIDAVIIATPDHWHDHISIAAMKAGKHVYCEKPMVQHLDEGHAVIKTQKETGMVMIVGSQGVSSITLAEAKRESKTVILVKSIWLKRSMTDSVQMEPGNMPFHWMRHQKQLIGIPSWEMLPSAPLIPPGSSDGGITRIMEQA